MLRHSTGTTKRGGTALIYVMASLVAFCGFASLGVDWGHVRLVRTQLQTAADSAARAAAITLIGGGADATSVAATVAGYNSADGSPVVLNTASDVSLGTWDSTTGTFTVLTGSATSTANAVRVYTRRTSATANPVSLSFAGLVGKSSCDVTAVSICTVKPTGYGLVGLKSISLSGNSTDSYWSPEGYSSGNFGSIASNGNITLSGSSSIHGDARPGIGCSVSNPSAVSGSTTPLTTVLSYPAASPTSYSTSNNDNLIPSAYLTAANDFKLGGSSSLTLPGGTYYMHNVSIGSQCVLSFTGPATVYVYGTFNMSGGASTYANLPGNLNIIVGPDPTGKLPGTLTLSGSSALYANIYAPQSNITLSGTGDLYGSVLGLSVSSSGTSAIHYDASLSGPGTISLVQ